MVARSLAKTSPRMRTARARSLATRTTLRSTRSARTPASGLAMVGSRRATSAPPTAEALPVIWTTNTTSATIETASPTNEVPWPIQSRKKRPFRRSESLVESIPTDLAFGRLQPDAGPMSEKGIQFPRSSYPASEFHDHRTRCRVSPLQRRDVVCEVLRVQERDQLEVRPVVERYQGVARQAIGVLAAERNRESEAFIICRGQIEVIDEYHQVVQTG